MRGRGLSRVWVAVALGCLLLSCPGLGQDIEGETTAPYPIQKEGLRLSFSQLDKKYLGRKCTVYFKPGVTYPLGKSVEQMEPDLIVYQSGRSLMNGELYEIGRHHLAVWWVAPH